MPNDGYVEMMDMCLFGCCCCHDGDDGLLFLCTSFQGNYEWPMFCRNVDSFPVRQIHTPYVQFLAKAPVICLLHFFRMPMIKPL